MEATSTLVTSLLDRAPAGALACRQGCAHCCHQRVGVTVPEALAIFAALVASRSTAQLRQLKERVERAYRSTRGLSRDERNSPEHACPLLEHDLCSIYEVRPLSCRGAHSLDAEACKSRLHDRERRGAYERGELPGHSFVEPVRAVHAISAGLQLGLHEGLGLDMRPLDLTAALHLLLSEVAAEPKQPARNPSSNVAPAEAAPPPDSEPVLWASLRVQHWLDGLPTFAEAHGGDATDHQGQVELSGAVALGSRRREDV